MKALIHILVESVNSIAINTERSKWAIKNENPAGAIFYARIV